MLGNIQHSMFPVPYPRETGVSACNIIKPVQAAVPTLANSCTGMNHSQDSDKRPLSSSRGIGSRSQSPVLLKLLQCNCACLRNSAAGEGTEHFLQLGLACISLEYTAGFDDWK